MSRATETIEQVRDPRRDELVEWLTQAGLFGRPHDQLLEDYCLKLVELGVPLMRLHVTQQAIHPVYGGVGFNWRHDEGPVRAEYEHQEEASEIWRRSPFFHMISNREFVYREKLHDTQTPSRFSLLNELKAQGATDYLAVAMAYEDWNDADPIKLKNMPEGALISWMCHGEGGFSEADLALIRASVATLGLVLKADAKHRTARDLLGIYLGRDAGQRVLSGEITRGSSRWINAVICYFDLEGFTTLSQNIDGEELIALLNSYFGIVVATIHAHQGNVLKFMGDGLLAIFDREALPDAAVRALQTTTKLQQQIAELNGTRKGNSEPTMGFTMALHAGQVLYGNIGADERLDFTVIGPEVNLTARIAGMHRALGQHIIVSDSVASDVQSEEFDLVSLGRYMLRGVSKPKELFTIYRA